MITNNEVENENDECRRFKPEKLITRIDKMADISWESCKVNVAGGKTVA